MSAAADENARPTIGFAGLGRMGAPMAERIATAGHPLVVWNRSADKARAFAERTGCEVVTGAAELATAADVVITMLADGAALESFYFDDPAFAEGLAGGLAIDMGTIGPELSGELDERLRERGVRFLEAPVSGSTAAAEAGVLTIMVGGPEEDFRAAAPLLGAIGEPVLRLGEVGSAAVMKLVVNNLIYSINQSLSEGLVLAENAGIDRAEAYDVILGSAAAAPMIGYRREVFLHPGEVPVSFTLELEKKDMGLVIDLAERLGSPMPQARLNRELVDAAIAAGHGAADVAAIAEYLKEGDRD